MSKEFKDIETVIGSTVKIEGDFKGDGDIIVEGVVDGSLKTKKHLAVGENAKINASVEAGSAFVAGVIKGNVKISEALELSSTAKIEGDIEAKILTIATGAQINGNVKMGGELTVENIGEKEKNK
jgi:cytoskeletal protein CcmA (bactofilin family)